MSRRILKVIILAAACFLFLSAFVSENTCDLTVKSMFGEEMISLYRLDDSYGCFQSETNEERERLIRKALRETRHRTADQLIPAGRKASVPCGTYLAQGTMHRMDNAVYSPEPLLVILEQSHPVAAYMKYRMTEQPDTSDDYRPVWLISMSISMAAAAAAGVVLMRRN